MNVDTSRRLFGTVTFSTAWMETYVRFGRAIVDPVTREIRWCTEWPELSFAVWLETVPPEFRSTVRTIAREVGHQFLKQKMTIHLLHTVIGAVQQRLFEMQSRGDWPPLEQLEKR